MYRARLADPKWTTAPRQAVIIVIASMHNKMLKCDRFLTVHFFFFFFCLILPIIIRAWNRTGQIGQFNIANENQEANVSLDNETQLHSPW